jgi:16S rRNA (cytosine967-C5)-methyltransferase
MSVSPARRAAFEVVRRVFEDDAYADRALRSATEGLDARERAFAQQLAYGTVQRLRTLDHAIETLGRRPVRKLDAPVLASLRLGAYQLGYLDVPPHAAANESVELVRGARLERAVPFTNAVMRRMSEGIERLLAELPEGPLKHSYPDWIHGVWVRDFGDDAAGELMRVQNEPPETVVRLVRGEIDGEPTDVPGAYRVARIDEEALAEGRLWPQSRASQLAAFAVGSREGERVLDSCAAPGGKATMLRGEVTAVELNEARARELEENARRLGAGNVTVVHADATVLPPRLGGFDRALVDEWPKFRHPTRPEFLLTLPHVHRTSGFFIARLRVP